MARLTALERQEQRAILRWLALVLPAGAVVLHVPNEEASGSAARGKALLGDGVLPGCPDLCVVWQGRAHWIEVKRRGRRAALRATQEEAHRRLALAGCPVGVATGPEEADALLREWGVPLKLPPPAWGRAA
ncbi:VRR-NUC domain-containing protein [Falsiroseomonas selenitidurans]|uniref:VRR-NUC domain-containing protein n=1 Tax=Falsiroseomonas selenitidurans TaxID=2716335 RepID=A0ABX1E3U6_9PROT|nr:VRR-NUC domain-containing protein [Falsiroseomonas selenitidurans]NKC30187.1 hypothetical protein [Falsiroseomonas selenitidurans]